MATNIDKAMIPSDLDIEGNDLEVILSPEEELEITEEDLAQMAETEQEDGSVIVDFAPSEASADTADEHATNLAFLGFRLKSDHSRGQAHRVFFILF